MYTILCHIIFYKLYITIKIEIKYDPYKNFSKKTMNNLKFGLLR